MLELFSNTISPPLCRYTEKYYFRLICYMHVSIHYANSQQPSFTDAPGHYSAIMAQSRTPLFYLWLNNSDEGIYEDLCFLI